MPPATTVDDTNNLGEGDSHLVLDLLPEDENWMEELKQEVQFRAMLHRGTVDIFIFKSFLYIFSFGSAGGEVPRLVAVQGEINKDGRLLAYILQIHISDSPICHPIVTQSTGIQPTPLPPSSSSLQRCLGSVPRSKRT